MLGTDSEIGTDSASSLGTGTDSASSHGTDNKLGTELPAYPDFSNFIDYDSEYDSCEEDEESVLSDYSDIESVGNAVSIGGNPSEEDADYDQFMVEYVVPTPKSSQPSAKRQRVVGTETLAPITILVANTIGCCKSQRILRVLCDSGSGKTLIHKRAVPRKAQPISIATKKFNTLAGKLAANKMVHMRDVRLPEFNKNRSIGEQKALVFDQPCRYDVILGSDFLNRAGMVIDYSKDAKHVKWFDEVIPLRTPTELTKEGYQAMIEQAYADEDNPYLEEEDGYLSHILDAKYEEMDIDEVMSKQTHLTESQRKDLKRLLLKYPTLFDGKLRKYEGRLFHINVDPDAEPVAKRAYPVP